MPPTPRERFNAKARRSVAGGSSHKKRKVRKPRKDEGEGQEHADANAEILVEKTKEERERYQRELMRQEVCLVAL
jgi:ATP-dependent RNA helicase DHX37/DHR1